METGRHGSVIREAGEVLRPRLKLNPTPATPLETMLSLWLLVAALRTMTPPPLSLCRPPNKHDDDCPNIRKELDGGQQCNEREGSPRYSTGTCHQARRHFATIFTKRCGATVGFLCWEMFKVKRLSASRSRRFHSSTAWCRLHPPGRPIPFQHALLSRT